MEAKVIEKKSKSPSLIEEIAAVPGGEKIYLCMQCGTCTASCPSAQKMDHSPAELMALIRAGRREEVLSSKAMWYCLSCYMCTVRCPRGIKPTEIMHILEYLAEREGLTNRHIRTPAMYRTFSEQVARRGIILEIELMVRYFLRTNLTRAFGMTSAAVGLLRHGRINLKGKSLSPGGTKQLQAILSKARSCGAGE